MNPMYAKILGSLLRAAMAGIVPALLAAGIAESDIEKIITLVIGFVVATVWSIWEKIQARKKLVTALAMPTTSTEAQVVAKVADGGAPSVMTPANVVPLLTMPAGD